MAYNAIPGVEWINAYGTDPAAMDVRAVLFDLDGTVLDTEKLYVRFWREGAQACGYPMTHDQALGMRSLNSQAGEARLKGYFGPECDYHAVREMRKKLMNAFIEREGVEAKPGIRELLAYLKEQHIATAIVTASPPERALEHLTRVGLADGFDRILSCTMVKRGKPEPDVYLFAAAEMGVSPAQCITLEDSPNGLLSASRAGCHPVMIPDQDQPDEAVSRLLLAKADRLDCVIGLLKALGC